MELKELKLFVFVLFTLLFLPTCRGPTKIQEKPPIELILEEGWSFFRSGEYTRAYFKFLEATNHYPDDPRGWTGLGFSFLVLYDLVNSHFSFMRSHNLDPNNDDNLAGLSIADSDPVPNPSLYNLPYDSIIRISINSATLLLERNPSYLFQYDHRINGPLIRINKARGLVNLGMFEEALDEVRIIDPNFYSDISTPEGRFLLIQRISELIDSLSGGLF